MGWARFDDNYTDHLKVRDLSPLAELLDMRAVIYCARHETDGLVTTSRLKMFSHQIPRVSQKVDELIAYGRWETNAAGGWIVHDYLAFNPSKAQKADERARGKERQQRHRHGVTDASRSRGRDGDHSATEEREDGLGEKSKAPWLDEGKSWAVWNREQLAKAKEAGA